MRSKLNLSAIAVLFLLLLGGCEPRLETGYIPRPLNSTEPMRRSYYAPAYSAEAAGTKKGDENGPGLLDH